MEPSAYLIMRTDKSMPGRVWTNWLATKMRCEKFLYILLWFEC